MSEPEENDRPAQLKDLSLIMSGMSLSGEGFGQRVQEHVVDPMLSPFVRSAESQA